MVERIDKIRVTKDEIIADLVDGRVIYVPIVWSWRLSEATPAQRVKFRLIGGGKGVHWPEIDEDLSVEGLLHGIPARPARAGGTTWTTPASSSKPRTMMIDARMSLRALLKVVGKV